MMAAALPVLAAWLGLRLTLLGRQRACLRRQDAAAPGLIRLRVAAWGLAAEAAVLAGLLAGGGLAALDRLCPGLPAAALALLARAAVIRGTASAAARLATLRPRPWGWRGLWRGGLGLLLGGAAEGGLLAVYALLLPGHWLGAWALRGGSDLARHWLLPALSLPWPGGGGGPAERDLPEGALAGRLRALLAGCGLDGCRLRVAEGRGVPGQLNARFVGLRGARRIVLSPTLVEGLEPGEVAAVVAHEAGHCRLRHLEKWLALRLVLGLAAFAALPWGIPAVGLSEPASLAALWLLAEPALFFLRPLPAALRRRWELEADGFAASQVGAAAMLAALAKIDRGNKAPPDADPLYVAFCAFHPTPRERAARLQAIAAVQPDSPGRSQPG